MYYGNLRQKRQCFHVNAHVNSGKMKKCRWLHRIYGIRVSYFRSGDYDI